MKVSSKVLLRTSMILTISALLTTACGSDDSKTEESAPTVAVTDSVVTDPADSVATTEPPPVVEPATIKVASGEGVYRGALDVGIAHGYFEEEGLTIEIEPIATGPEQVPLMASGQVDVAFTGPSAAHFNALAAGVPVRFVASCGSSDPTGEFPNGVFSVRTDLIDSGRVKTISDLAGLKISVPNVESKGFVDLHTILASAGVSIDDVEVIAPMSFPDAAAALESGATDAGFLVEPFASLSQSKGISTIFVGDNDIMNGRLGCAVAFGSRLVEDQSLGDRFMRAYLRGARDYHEAFFNGVNRDEVFAIEVASTPIDDAGLFDLLSPNFIDPNGEVNAASLELDISVYEAQGYLSATPSIEDILDSGYATRAVEALGRFTVG